MPGGAGLGVGGAFARENARLRSLSKARFHSRSRAVPPWPQWGRSCLRLGRSTDAQPVRPRAPPPAQNQQSSVADDGRVMGDAERGPRRVSRAGDVTARSLESHYRRKR